mmetsp:Transcript_26987/g.68436  ORF Transcript_26987/g.68436 Transcript_26987/m.68436 type:complete len:206 (+) Transcript_26987:63-680(+)
MKLAVVCLGVACGDALKLSCRPPTTAGGRHAAVHRRAFLGSAATAASLLVCPPAFAGGKKKEYLTMAEYQKLKDDERKEEELYGKFETLRTRARQTKAFDEYASKGEWEPISDLARAWDSTIRKDVLESAAKSLSGDDKAEAARISKAILADLKGLDKLAKAKAADDVPKASAALKGHVLEFTKLEPKRLAERFGDSSDGAVEDL